MNRPEKNLFAQLLGNDFFLLPSAIQFLHQKNLPYRFVGAVKITPAKNALTRFLARIVGLPTIPSDAPFFIDIEPDAKFPEQLGQIWTRAFPPRPFRSRLRAHQGFLLEQMGPATLRFRLIADANGIEWTLSRVRLLGVPIPLIFFGTVKAREFVLDQQYQFEVLTTLPVLGHLVGYRGWLEVQK